LHEITVTESSSTPSTASRALTVKARSFCEHYAATACRDRIDSYFAAGYKAKDRVVARAAVNQLLDRPDVEAYLSELIAARSQRTQINGDRVLEELGRIAFSNIVNYYIRANGKELTMKDLLTLPDEMTAAIQEISSETTKTGSTIVRFKLHSKGSSLKALQSYFGVDLNPIELMNRLKSLGFGVLEEGALAKGSGEESFPSADEAGEESQP
jgi:phage terminase small subunit